ncbi:MAG: aminopeptidase [Pseudomonadota bacterium]|nr:aminopeptidase [Pseudomonadota bacterium]
MLAKIAAFEFRYQIKNPVFWVTAGLFFLFSYGFLASDRIQIGVGGNVRENSPFTILQTYSIFSLFFMFVTTAFVANVIVRDDDTGYGPIIRSTRITKFDYLIGRFLGAFAISVLAFTAIPLGIFVGSLMPWLDPETLGPNRLHYYVYPLLVVAIPNLLITAAIFFSLATITRSMMATYLGVVIFLVVYFVTIVMVRDRPELESTVALIEPFGVRAVSTFTRYWTAAERNTLLPPLEGVLLYNRLLWIALSAGFLALAHFSYRFATAGISKKKLRRQSQQGRPAGMQVASAPPPKPLPNPAEGGRAARAQLWQRASFEMMQVFKSPAFIVLIFIGLANTIPSLWIGGELFGTANIPVTRTMIQILEGAFTIVPLIIAIYYAGELVWRERDRKMHEIIDATPLPNWAYIIPKTAAVALVLLATLVVSVVAAILVQLAKGYTNLELDKYLLWYLVPQGFDMVLLAVLAVFVQAMSPNKYVGWGIMVIYLVSQMIMSSLGLEHNLYNYGGSPDVPLSDINGTREFMTGTWTFRIYWAAFAIMLLVAAHLLWRRGTETRLKPRLARAPRRLRGAPGLVAGLALTIFLGTGAYAFYNTNIRNEYRTSKDEERLKAEYEKKFLRYERLSQPAVSRVRLNIELFPSEGRAVTRGAYRLTNLTGQPIRDVHVRLGDTELELRNLTFPGTALVFHDEEYGYRIYRLAQPMAPGETRELSFETLRARRGFTNDQPERKLVRNGTFLNNLDLAPVIGMGRTGLLRERTVRRKYGLPADLRPAKLEDISGTKRSFFGVDWTTADITLTTSADQTPIAPGKKIMDVTREGRRTARFVSDAPILNFFSVQSARYAKKSRRHAGVDLSVYYHPDHHWNVDRMLTALQTSLDYYQPAFGPYQFDQARIIEFPAYETFAQAFANTMPYSESIGFIADTSDPNEIDYVTYVTAHELGHQWWAHQVIGADMQGSTMLSETLAQYSALMVMKKLYGEDKIRRFLKYELDQYLRSRGGEAVEELPLGRVENQAYIHYRKGSVAMYLLQERLGEEAVNRALRSLVQRFRFRGAPYPRSVDLIKALRAEAKTPEQQALITDLFERITLYDLKVSQPKAVKRADGMWDVAVPVEAKKLYANGQGEETEARLAEAIEVGLFTAEPGRGAFDAKNVILMQRQPIRSGKQVLKFVANKKPTHAGVDPYNFYVDRNSADNVVPVT